MLALTRKKGESIIIGDSITITVLSTSGDSIKLGISAPRHIPVNRKEIYEQIQEQNKQAAQITASPEAIADLSKLIKNQKPEE